MRWLLDLMAPRLIAGSAAVYRQRELDAPTLARSFAVWEQLLHHASPQPRSALAAALQRAGIRTDEQRLYSLLHRAVLEKLLCPAGRQGAEPTYALLDDWLPPAAPARPRPEAVAELAGRYFRSHGPATLADFAWWAGLPLTEARGGLEAVQPQLQAAQLDGHTYWLPEPPPGPAQPPAPGLLPGFDEYLIAYKDRSLLLDPAQASRVMTVNGIFRPIVVVNGRVAGTWKRTTRNGAVELQLFGTLPESSRAALAAAAEAVAGFYR